MSDSSQKIPYPLRMPDDLRKQLEDARSGRSLNAEIVRRLEESFLAQTSDNHLALLYRLEGQLSKYEADFQRLCAASMNLAAASKLVTSKLTKTAIKQDAGLKDLVAASKALSDLLDSNLK